MPLIQATVGAKNTIEKKLDPFEGMPLTDYTDFTDKYFTQISQITQIKDQNTVGQMGTN